MALFQLIADSYNQLHRSYHRQEHLEYMLLKASSLGVTVKKYSPLWYAVLFHDIHYEPTLEAGENERISAEMFRHFVKYQAGEEDNITEVRHKQKLVENLILATVNHTPNPEILDPEYQESVKTLIDLDLLILSEDTKAYGNYRRGIREEYIFIPKKKFNKARAKWIRSMLSREKIYYTDWGALREANARINLHNELLALEFGADAPTIEEVDNSISVLRAKKTAQAIENHNNGVAKNLILIEHDVANNEQPKIIDFKSTLEAIDDAVISQIFEDIKINLQFRLDQKGRKPFASTHEIYGILAEEFDELMSELRTNNLKNFEIELKDIIIGALWGIFSLRKGVKW